MNSEQLNSFLSVTFISSIIGFFIWQVQRLMKQKDDLQNEKVERLESQQFVQSDDVKELTVTIRELTTQFKMSNDYQKKFNEKQEKINNNFFQKHAETDNRLTNLEAQNEK